MLRALLQLACLQMDWRHRKDYSMEQETMFVVVEASVAELYRLKLPELVLGLVVGKLKAG